MSGAVAIFGGLTLFYVVLRKDLQKAEDDRQRIKTELQTILKEGLQKAENDRQRIKTELEDDILRLEDRVVGPGRPASHEAPPADPEPTHPPPETNPARAESRNSGL